jgi:hypothetical protein
MAQLTGYPSAAAQPLYSSSSVGMHGLGEKMVTDDGRKFVYCQAGAVTLVAGNFIQAPAQIGNHQNIAPLAAAIGATSVTVALGATAVTANQYAGGYVSVTITPDLGGIYMIDSHPAAALSTSVVLKLKDPIRVAWTTSTRVDLIPNQYGGVIQTPVTTLTGAVVGVTPFAILANEFGWIQRSGPCNALIAGTPGVGLAIVVPGTAAGAAVVDGAASETLVVGSMIATGGNGETNAVMLALE